MLQYCVFLSGESHGQSSLVGHGPWGHRDLDMTEVTEHIMLLSFGHEACGILTPWPWVNSNPEHCKAKS